VPVATPAYSGFTDGDTADSLTVQPTCTTTYHAGDPQGGYQTKCTGAQDVKYVINFVPGSLTVDPAPLKITASSGTMIYGATPPTIVPMYSGFVNGEGASSLATQPTCSTVATGGSAVGTYASACVGAVDANYAIQYAAGAVNIAYGQAVLAAHTQPKNSGSSVPIEIRLLNASGANISSPTITLRWASPAATPDPSPGTQPAGAFIFVEDNTGGMYQYNLKTKGYPAGTYTLSFVVTSDSTIHTVTFALR